MLCVVAGLYVVSMWLFPVSFPQPTAHEKRHQRPPRASEAREKSTAKFIASSNQQQATTSTMGGDSFSSGTFNDPKHVVSGSGLERTIYSSVSDPKIFKLLTLLHVANI